MRTIGLVLAVATSVLWLLIAGLFVLPIDDGSVPLGRLGLYFLAVPMSIVTAVLLALTLRTTRTPARRTAAALAVGSAALLACIFFLGETASTLPDYMIRGSIFLGIATFVAATALFALPARGVELPRAR